MRIFGIFAIFAVISGSKPNLGSSNSMPFAMLHVPSNSRRRVGPLERTPIVAVLVAAGEH
jgi:hypothetical protein